MDRKNPNTPPEKPLPAPGARREGGKEPSLEERLRARIEAQKQEERIARAPTIEAALSAQIAAHLAGETAARAADTAARLLEVLSPEECTTVFQAFEVFRQGPDGVAR